MEPMKIVFVSNFFNHHQKPFCEAMYGLLGDNFCFISTSVMSQERIKLGYAQDDTPPYVCKAYTDSRVRQRAMELINGADAVIAGSAPAEYLTERLRAGRLVLRYSERIYKKKPSVFRRIYHAVKLRMRDHGSKNVYMLCASAYTASDFRSLGMYKNRTYKWGYFPEVKAHDLDTLFREKKQNTILWCGRFIDWKHPDDAIRIAKRLKAAGFDFRLNMIGTGAMEEELKKMTQAYGLTDVVRFLGSMPPERVRAYMEEAGIYLFTSDRQEGWGAVLNEAMASGCAVVASNAAGATPFLVQDGENGLVYQSGNFEELLEKVRQLLCKPTEQEQYGHAAYRTIVNTWNGKVAAERLLKMIEQLLNKESYVELYENGPCSRA